MLDRAEVLRRRDPDVGGGYVILKIDPALGLGDGLCIDVP
jgi:hypothetical protein